MTYTKFKNKTTGDILDGTIANTIYDSDKKSIGYEVQLSSYIGEQHTYGVIMLKEWEAVI